jgi:hypothetical protein
VKPSLVGNALMSMPGFSFELRLNGKPRENSNTNSANNPIPRKLPDHSICRAKDFTFCCSDVPSHR